MTASTAVRVRGARMGCAAQAVTCAEAWRERRHKPKRDAGGTANGRVSAANTQPAHRSLSMAWGGVQAGQYDQHQHRNAAPTPIWHAGPSGCADLPSRGRHLPQRAPISRPAPSGANREHTGCAVRGTPSAGHPGTHGQATASPSAHRKPTQDTKPLAPWAWTPCVTKKKEREARRTSTPVFHGAVDTHTRVPGTMSPLAQSPPVIGPPVAAPTSPPHVSPPQPRPPYCCCCRRSNHRTTVSNVRNMMAVLGTTRSKWVPIPAYRPRRPSSTAMRRRLGNMEW